jgi:hypothetical protein
MTLRRRVSRLEFDRRSFNNKAITDANGNLLLVNPAPGTAGTLGLKTIEGPADFKLDINLIKRVKLAESKELQIQLSAINVLNHPVFANPNVSINSVNFGRITATSTGTTPRQLMTSLRFNF